MIATSQPADPPPDPPTDPPTEPAAPPVLCRTIVLIGIMGAGKTSVGQALARRLAVPFTDSDHEIEAAAGMAVPDIFARFGEAYFRGGERRVIARLLAGPPRVLATGGGAFVEPETRAAIRGAGLTVWLRADLDTIWDRVKGKGGRPLLAGPDPRGTLRALMDRRYPVYAEADVTVESRAHERQDQAAERIVAALHDHDATALPAARVFAREPPVGTMDTPPPAGPGAAP